MRKALATAAATFVGMAASVTGAQAQSSPAPVTVPTPSFYTFLPSPTPGPGTVTVRFNARVNFYAGVFSDSGRNPGIVTSTASSATSLGSPQTNTKLAPYTFGEYGRFYPGFDGIAGNGLKYGAAMQIRQDNAEPPGGGINGSISAGTRNRNTIYTREEYVYLSGDQIGTLRLGATGGPATLFSTGTFENFNDGGWNGDAFLGFTGNTVIAWPYATASSYYGTTKAIYLSPQFSGVDFGVSFEPNTGNGSFAPGNCPYGVTANAGITGPVGGGLAPLGCDAASSTSTGDYARRRNTVEAGIRYRGTFGAAGVAVEGVGIFSGRVTDNSTPPKAVQFYNQAIGDGGAQVTYGGLAFGGHLTGGQVNGALNTLLPQGERDEFSWLVGTSYAFGPFVIGASYYDLMTAGSKTATSSPWIGNRNEVGVAAGGTYNFAPGMNLFLSYLYGQRHELGIDFLSGATSSGTATRVTTHNNVQAQGIVLGSQFRW